MDRSTSQVIKVKYVFITILMGIGFLVGYMVYKFRPADVVIGVLYTPKQSYHCTVIEEIKQIVSKSGKSLSIKEFAPTTNIDQLLVQAAANAALEDESVSLVISVGAICSQTLVGISKRRKSAKPLVFIGADNPIGLGLVSSIEKPGLNVTGVIAQSSYVLNAAELLHLVKKEAKAVLVPHFTRDATLLIDEQIDAAKAYCDMHNIILYKLPIDDLSHAIELIAHYLASCDTLLYFEGDVLCSLSHNLAKICTQYGVTLFAGSIDVADNAAFCYAIEPKIEAREAFKLVEKILFEGVDPGSIAVVQPKDCRDFVINVGVCHQQGVKDVDPAAIINRIRSNPALSLIHNRIVVMP